MNCFIGRSCWQQDIKKREIRIAVLQGCLLFGVIAWLFYDSWFAFILFPFFMAGFLLQWMKDCCRQKEEEFCIQFRDGIRALATSLRAGYSVENALRETIKDIELIHGKDSRIRREFHYMIRQLDMNVSVEEVLYNFGKRVPQEDVESFVTVFTSAGKYGGDSIAVIQNTIKVLCDKLEVQQEIQTLVATKRFEFKVMTMIPLGIIWYMRLSFGEFMDVLYGNLLGVFIMTVCLMMYLGAWLLGKRMIAIEI